jgi:hypothetical protein
MALPAWPDWVIDFEPLNDPLEMDPPDDVILRSDFEQGMARQRRIFRNGVTTFNLQWALSADQHAVFIGFMRVVRGGKFTVPVFVSNAYVTVTAQFVAKSLKSTRSGGEWIVAAQVETADVLEPGDTDYASLLLTYGSDQSVEELSDLFHDAVQNGFYGALA